MWKAWQVDSQEDRRQAKHGQTGKELEASNLTRPIPSWRGSGSSATMNLGGRVAGGCPARWLAGSPARLCQCLARVTAWLVSLYTYIYIYMYTYIYIYMCIHIHIYIYICIHTYMMICVYIHIHISISLSISLSLSIYIYIYVHMYIHMYTHTHYVWLLALHSPSCRPAAWLPAVYMYV